MIINCRNSKIIDNIYIHDSIFSGFSYNYKSREIFLECEQRYLNKRFRFLFHNVILCNMQSCSFWHGGNSILDISLEESSSQMNELIEIQNQHKELYKGSYLDQGISYLQIKFEINSGDILFIICESFDLEEEPYSRKRNF